MRRSSTGVMLLLILIGTLGCGHPSARLQGSWVMVYPSDASREHSVEDEPDGELPVKILTDTHFAFGSTGPDWTLYAGGGRYELDGDTYTETIAYHFNPKLVGKTLSFTCRLDGDRWYHTGIFEVDGDHFHIEEIWRRIK